MARDGDGTRSSYESHGGDPAQYDAWRHDPAAQRLWMTSGYRELPDGYLHPDSWQGKLHGVGNTPTQTTMEATTEPGTLAGPPEFPRLLAMVLALILGIIMGASVTLALCMSGH